MNENYKNKIPQIMTIQMQRPKIFAKKRKHFHNIHVKYM